MYIYIIIYVYIYIYLYFLMKYITNLIWFGCVVESGSNLVEIWCSTIWSRWLKRRTQGMNQVTFDYHISGTRHLLTSYFRIPRVPGFQRTAETWDNTVDFNIWKVSVGCRKPTFFEVSPLVVRSYVSLLSENNHGLGIQPKNGCYTRQSHHCHGFPGFDLLPHWEFVCNIPFGRLYIKWMSTISKKAKSATHGPYSVIFDCYCRGQGYRCQVQPYR